MKDALNEAYEAGVIVVCAAGNYVNSVVAPAKQTRTVAVGGVTQERKFWCNSSYGEEVDFSGPAAGLRRASTEKAGDYQYGGGGDGTSYATAITSGAAALWLALHGDALNRKYPEPWMRVAAFTKLARQTTLVPDGWQPNSFGTGILQIDKLLKAPLPSITSLRMDPAI